MISEFKIEIDGWLASDEEAGELSLTSAEIRIEVNGILATEVEDLRSQSVRKSVRISAGLLAEWLLFNWWRLRWEPERQLTGLAADHAEWIASHSLPGIGHGFVWPLLTLSSDGNRIWVNIAKSSFSEDLSPVRYLNSYTGSISVKAFEIAVDDFVLRVLSRLESTGIKASNLHQIYHEVQVERTSNRLASIRKLEAMAGIDPDDDPALIKVLISKWSKKIGRGALDEIAAAQPSPASIESSLQLAQAAASQSSNLANLSEIYKLRGKIDFGDSAPEVAPWVTACRAAAQVRMLLELGSSKIKSRSLAALLETSESAFKTGVHDAPFPLMARVEKSERFILVIGRKYEQNRRFDAARLIGDALSNDSNDLWRPATKGNTSRQKFQRAFAAEFLCPSDVVAERISKPLTLDSIDDLALDLASEYGVSPWVVSTHLVNRGLAPATILSPFSH